MSQRVTEASHQEDKEGENTDSDNEENLFQTNKADSQIIFEIMKEEIFGRINIQDLKRLPMSTISQNLDDSSDRRRLGNKRNNYSRNSDTSESLLPQDFENEISGGSPYESKVYKSPLKVGLNLYKANDFISYSPSASKVEFPRRVPSPYKTARVSSPQNFKPDSSIVGESYYQQNDYITTTGATQRPLVSKVRIIYFMLHYS